MPIAEELAFLARIRERPDDDGPRLIFADWLDERGEGDSRGEFIRIQCALDHLPHDDPRRADLVKREQILLEAHQAAWMAELNGLAYEPTYRRGLIEAIAVDSTAFVERGNEIFDHGLIRRVRFIEASRCLARLVESPWLRQIAEIDLCGNSIGNAGINLLARAQRSEPLELLQLGFNDVTDQGLRKLADTPLLDGLRELYLGDNPLIGTPGLRALADSPYLGSLRLLDISGNGLNESALRVIVNGEALRQLDALILPGNQIGDGGVESLAHSELVQRILRREPSLDLSRNNIGPIGARALAESPGLAPLETLNLNVNTIGDAGLASLAQSPHFRNLKRLLLRENRIGDVGVIALARSQLPVSLIELDLTGNLVTSDSIRALDDATIALDWRKKIEIHLDPGLHLRATRLPR